MFGYTDLGIHGHTYEIKEQNIKELIEERLSKLDRNKLKQEYLNAIEKAFTSEISLPPSIKDHSVRYQDFVIASYDVPDPAHPNNILYPKGSKIVSSLPEGAVLKMCFVDGSDMDVLHEVYEEFRECDYMVTKADIRKLSFLGSSVYPMNIAYVQRFKIDKLPVKLVMQKDTVEKIYLNVNRLKKEVQEKKNAY
jgi:hypothetical protein